MIEIPCAHCGQVLRGTEESDLPSKCPYCGWKRRNPAPAAPAVAASSRQLRADPTSAPAAAPPPPTPPTIDPPDPPVPVPTLFELAVLARMDGLAATLILIAYRLGWILAMLVLVVIRLWII